VSTNESRGQRIAKHLIQIGAVSFSPDKPFTWASGLRSPIYCDSRATLAHPEIRDEIAEGFVDLMRAGGRPVEAVIGIATGAIAHASFVAARSRLPLGYIRAAAKEHGKANRLEGFVREGARVAVIEDLISTGGSSLAAVAGVRDAGMDAAYVMAIFTYGFPFAHAAFDEAGVRLMTLVHLDDLISAARESGVLDREGEADLAAWAHDPRGWSAERFGA